MQIDFTTKTSDELRNLIARGIFPPIAGADDGEAPEAAEAAEDTTPNMDDIVTRATTHETEEPEQVEEQEASDDAEVEPEQVETPADELDDEDGGDIIDAETIEAAVQIAQDPDHELYDEAVGLLRDTSPAIAHALGLGEEEEGDDGPEYTGDPRIDAALDRIDRFEKQQAQREQAEQTAAEQKQQEEMAAAYRADLLAVAGEDTPETYDEMDANQKLIATALLGLDGYEDDPKAALEGLLADRDKETAQKAIDEYVAGKSDYKPTAKVERNGATTSTHPQSPGEGTASLAGIITKHTVGQNGVSG